MQHWSYPHGRPTRPPTLHTLHNQSPAAGTALRPLGAGACRRGHHGWNRRTPGEAAAGWLGRVHFASGCRAGFCSQPLHWLLRLPAPNNPNYLPFPCHSSPACLPALLCAGRGAQLTHCPPVTHHPFACQRFYVLVEGLAALRDVYQGKVTKPRTQFSGCCFSFQVGWGAASFPSAAIAVCCLLCLTQFHDVAVPPFNCLLAAAAHYASCCPCATACQLQPLLPLSPSPASHTAIG